MSSFKIDLKQIRQVTVSWLAVYSMILAPFAASRPAFALEGFEEASELTESAKLTADLLVLLDRAYYPGVPRKNPSLVPLEVELGKIESRLFTLKRDLDANFAHRIAHTVVGSEDEDALLANLASYFTAAQHLEELKYLMGQRRFDPSAYTLAFDTTEFAQVNFLARMSFFSKNFADLDALGIYYSAQAAEVGRLSNFTTHLQNQNGRWMLVSELKPDFISDTETTSMVSTPTTRNVLRMALLFIASQLYDSQAIGFQLLRQSMTTLPEPSQAVRAEFLSMGFRKAALVRQENLKLSAARKPQILEKILNAVDAANKNGQGYIVDEELFETYYRLTEVPTTAEENQFYSKQMNLVESESFQYVLGSLLNFADLSDTPGQLEYILQTAYRLAARKLLVADFDFRMPLSALGTLDQFNSYIDQKSTEVARQILSDGRLLQEVQSIMNKVTLESVLKSGRLDFQNKLHEEAAKINGFAKEEINLKYLLNSKQNELAELTVSDFVGNATAPITQGDYATGYLTYMKLLLTYLQGFKASQPIPGQLHKILEMRDQIKWNPSSLNGRIEGSLVKAINADAKQREKDLADLLRIGEMLKFEAYEKLAAGVVPTAETLGLSDPGTTDIPLIGFMFQSEKKNYVRAIKNDLLNAAPLLGASVKDDGYTGELWETLVAHHGSREPLFALVDKKLGTVLEQTHENMQILDRQMQKFTSTGGETLASAGDELSSLMGRAAQITVGFKQFAGFGAYYEDARQELVTPIYVMRQWAKLSDYSDKAFIFIAAYYVLQVANSKLHVASGIAKFTAALLTPIFGPSLRTLNFVLIGFLGLSIGKDLVEGFVIESGHYSTLEKFWACGSAQPCVTVFGDLSQQESLMNAPRAQAISTIAMLAGFMLAFRGIGKVWGYLTSRGGNASTNLIVKQKNALGLADDTGFTKLETDAAVNARFQAALRKYPNQPAYAEIVRLYAREAQATLETLIWKRAKEWAAAEKRFTPALRRLGLDPSDLKDLDLLTKKRASLVVERQNGLLSSADYNRHIYAINQMHEFVAPIYKQMNANPIFGNFMKRVWFSAGTTPMPVINGSLAHYADRYAKDYTYFTGQTMLKPILVNKKIRLGAVPQAKSSHSVDRFLTQLEKRLKSDPTLSQVSPSDLRAWMLKASGQ